MQAKVVSIILVFSILATDLSESRPFGAHYFGRAHPRFPFITRRDSEEANEYYRDVIRDAKPPPVPEFPLWPPILVHGLPVGDDLDDVIQDYENDRLLPLQ